MSGSPRIFLAIDNCFAYKRWTASARYGPRVVNIYSGHGTYSTLGLGHPDQRVRDVMHRKWMEPMMDAAADLGAGLAGPVFGLRGWRHSPRVVFS